MAEFKTFRDSKACADARWSELVARLIGDWHVLWEEVEGDYQGSAQVLAHSGGRFCFVGWEWGSCSYCDPYEDMTEDAALAEIRRDSMFFDDVESLRRWIAMLRETSDTKAPLLTAALATFERVCAAEGKRLQGQA